MSLTSLATHSVPERKRIRNGFIGKGSRSPGALIHICNDNANRLGANEEILDRPLLAVSRGSRCALSAAAGQIGLALGMAAYKRSREFTLSVVGALSHF